VNQTIHFVRKAEEKVAIPKQKMIVAALEYAKELEQIV
jgi:26S proteasome regulatory subunit N12